MFYRIFLLCILLPNVGFSDQKNSEELVLSTPDQLAHQDRLVGRLIGPLGGQFILKQTDLVVKGAEPLSLDRHYIAPSILSSYHGKGGDADRHYLYEHVNKTYRGWVFMPQLRLQILSFGNRLRVTDANGSTLDYHLTNGNAVLATTPHGISNYAGGTPGGQYDLRNTRITREKDKIMITSPEGVVRTYCQTHASSYLLEKERLANGRIRRYRYPDTGTVVESLDPNEQHVYASIAMTGTPKRGLCEFTTSSAQEVSYEYDTRVISGKWTENKHRDRRSFTMSSPPLLKTVNGPLRIPETISYNDRFQLDSYCGRAGQYQCQYRTAKAGAPATVNALSLPVGDGNTLVDVHTLNYNAPIAGTQDGSTTVDNIDGTRVVYHYSKNFLPQKISFYNVDQKLVKQTLYQWNADQRLTSMEWADGDGSLLCRISYEYDKFGNPILETLTGDLTGKGETDTCATRRLFSDDGFHLLLREETEAGKVITFQYLSNTNLLTARLTQAGPTIVFREFWVYDAYNNLIQTIADDGIAAEKDDLSGVTQRNVTSYVLRSEQPFLHMPEWTEESYWESGECHLLKRTHHTYDQYGNICQDTIYGADGQFAYNLHHTYDAHGQLLSETNALGQTSSYSYDDYGRCIWSCDSRKVEKRMQYDARGRLRQRVEGGYDGLQHTMTYDYDFNDRLIQQSDPLGNLTRYTYDFLTNKVTSTESPPVVSLNACPAPVLTRINYDAFGRKIAEVDANGNRTTFRCNAYGSPVEILHPNGSRETFVYTKSGKVQQQVDCSGLTITYSYDALERVVKKSYASSTQEPIAEEIFVYQGNNLVSQTDKEGNVTNYSYDGAGRKRCETSSGRTTLYSYDNLGRLITTTKQNGKNSLVTFVKLDLLGRVLETSKLDLEGTVLQCISHTYDDVGNRDTTVRYRSGSKAVEKTLYDSFARCIARRDALGHTTRTQYDETQCNALGQRVLVKTDIDPNGVMTVVTYDPYGREVKKEVRQRSQGIIACQEMCYDPAGNLLQHSDHLYREGIYQKTHQVAYTYDNSNHVTSLTRGINSPDARTTSFEYTPNCQLAAKKLPTGITLNYNYDPLGYLQSLTSSDGQLFLTYRYDRLGRLLHATDERNQIAIDRTIDAFGNVLSERFPMGLTVCKTYDAFDRTLSLSWSNRARVDYNYDPVHLRSVSHVLPSNQVLYSHCYEEYDLDGNLLKENLMAGLGRVQHLVDSKGHKTNTCSSYFNQHCVYDAVDNLVQSTIDKSIAEYGYDDLSQLTLEKTKGSGHSYLYDSHHNRVLTDDVTADVNDVDELLCSGSVACTYDLNGNLVAKRTPTETLHFTYDPLNRLTHADSEATRVAITYDPLGRRLSKVVHTAGYFGWGENCREHYLYDGENEIGAFSAEGKPKQVRTFGIAKHKNIPATVAIELDSKLYVPILDCQGNICRLINPTWGSIAESYQFDAFGKELHDASGYRNPWRYASKRFDPELQLVYFGKRYYDPQLARWLTTDPAGFVDGTNVYAYLLNNPFRYVDPDGRFVMALPLVTWGFAGLGWALPSLTTIITTTLVTTAVWYATETTLTHLGQYIAQQEWQWCILDKRRDDPTLPIDPANDPDWEDISHTQQTANGHRRYKHKDSGKTIREDEAKEGKSGHRGRRHYHHENSENIENDIEPKYYDEKGNKVRSHSEESHLYHPDQYPGQTW